MHYKRGGKSSVSEAEDAENDKNISLPRLCVAFLDLETKSEGYW
jgi:hypothetical protein